MTTPREARARPPAESWGTRAEAQHRVLVAVVSTLAVAAGGLLPEPERATQLAVLAVGVALLALPHGAVDPWLAVRPTATGTARLRFLLTYVGLAAFAVAVWIAAPAASLVVFLLVSAWHFGEGEIDPQRPSLLAPSVETITAGATPILAPLLFRPEETLALLGILGARDFSDALASPTWTGGVSAWLACRGVAWTGRLRDARRRHDAISLAIVLGQVACLMSFATLPVLLAFGLYFCVDHSLRHGLRVAVRFAPASRSEGLRRYVRRALPLTATTIGLAAVIGAFGLGGFREIELTRLVFIGLAALTLPHVTIGLPARALTSPIDGPA